MFVGFLQSESKSKGGFMKFKVHGEDKKPEQIIALKLVQKSDGVVELIACDDNIKQTIAILHPEKGIRLVDYISKTDGTAI